MWTQQSLHHSFVFVHENLWEFSSTRTRLPLSNPTKYLQNWEETDSPHSERCAGTRRWAGHCRCYNSSLWTSLHPRRPPTSSSSETIRRDKTHTQTYANMNVIKMQSGIKCQWTLQRVLEVHELANILSQFRSGFPSEWQIHSDSSAQNMVILSVRTSSHGWFWLHSWK